MPHDRVVRLRFSDSTERTIDLTPFLWGPAFEDIAADHELFAQVKADPETGTMRGRTERTSTQTFFTETSNRRSLRHPSSDHRTWFLVE